MSHNFSTNLSIENQLIAYNFLSSHALYKENFKKAFADFHIVANDHNAYIFFKLSFLQNAYIWYLNTIDKYVLLLGNFYGVKMKKKTKEIRKCIEKCHNGKISKELKKFYTTGNSYKKQRDLGNHIKHNQDEITSSYSWYFLSSQNDQIQLLQKIESKFYTEWLLDLFKAMNDFIIMVNKHFIDFTK